MGNKCCMREKEPKKKPEESVPDASPPHSSPIPARPPDQGDIPHGLPNKGTTCYLNSALQGLIATREFVDQCERYRGGPKALLLSALVALFKEYNTNTADTTPISNSISAIDPKFAQGNQHDSSYALSAIFSTLRSESGDDAARNPVGKCFEFMKAVGSTCGKCTVVKWNLQGSNMLHLDLDELKAGSARQCEYAQQSQPERKVKTLEISKGERESYSVPSNQSQVGSVNSIDSALRFNFASVPVKGLVCRTCGETTGVTQRLFVLNPPSHLIVCLKRYSTLGRRHDKDSRSILNEREIDMEGFVLTKEREFHKGKGEYKYELYAVLVHGGSLDGGHYFAYVKWSDNWYDISDQSVSKADYERNVKNACASVLFYKRVTHGGQKD